MTDKQAKDWIIDLDKVKAKEQEELNADIEAASKSRSDKIMYKWYARLVVSWPFDLNPSDINSYPELGLGQLREVTRRVFAEFQQSESPTNS